MSKSGEDMVEVKRKNFLKIIADIAHTRGVLEAEGDKFDSEIARLDGTVDDLMAMAGVDVIE